MILLFSGGLDSYIAYHLLSKPKTLYFDLRTPYSMKELETVQRLIPNTIIERCLELGNRQQGDNAYIPYRNLHLALLANKYDDTIVIAGLKDDRVNDKNEEVFRKWTALMSDMMGRPIKVVSPFWQQTKEQIVRWFLDNGGTERELKNTISCYSEGYIKECNWCPACFRKWCALRANNVDVPDFKNRDLMLQYLSHAKEGTFYIPERNETIIRVVTDFLKENR